jgi:amino acid adenylation domain-containing protein
MESNRSLDKGLGAGFLRSVVRFPERPALEVDGEVLTYRNLFDRAAALAATFQRSPSEEGPALTAVFAHRSVWAYTGVLAALLQGHGYVPLNPTFPTNRSRTMLELSTCRSLIVDRDGEAQLDQLLEGVEQSLVVLVPGRKDVSDLAAKWPAHTFAGSDDLAPSVEWVPPPVDEDALAYLLFTSGSTGMPKGVMVAHRNATAYISAMIERYDVSEHDRFSQLFEMTFDVSVFDMFVAWECGACLCCASKQQKLLPTAYIQEARLTVWFSVPSTGLLLKNLRLLAPRSYPNLRISLFAGEALPADFTSVWAKAAPNSIVENLYGPTELTVACTHYRWDEHSSPTHCELGVVPIGDPVRDMKFLVVDESLREVPPGETGELLMTGPQLSVGYWNEPVKTAQVFIVPPGVDEVYYRTGDRVRRPANGNPMTYLGRLDNQIKIRGHRVELGEIEAALREEAAVEAAVALGWPITDRGAEGIVAFLCTGDADVKRILDRLRERLPGYMVPKTIHLLRQFPLNSNGKIDRRRLTEMLSTSTPEP